MSVVKFTLIVFHTPINLVLTQTRGDFMAMEKSEYVKILRDVKNIELSPLKIKFDITTLDMTICFL